MGKGGIQRDGVKQSEEIRKKKEMKYNEMGEVSVRKHEEIEATTRRQVGRNGK